MSDETAAIDTSTDGSEAATPESAAPDLSGGGAPATDNGSTDIAGGAIAAQIAKDDAQAAAQARKWSLKYDGKDHEITSEEELIKLAQKGLGSDKRFEEAAASRKETEALKGQIERAARRMAEDPLEVLSAITGDEGRAAQIAAQRLIAHPKGRALLEKMLLEQLEYEGLPEADRKRMDEDRSLRERASKADRYEAEERKRAEEEERAKRSAAQQAEVAKLSQTYADEAKASLAAAGLDPNDPDACERWIMQRMAALEAGVELSAEDAAKRVASVVGGSRKGYLESLAALEGEALLGAIPAGLLAKIQTAAAEKLTGKVRGATRPAQAGARPKAAAPKVRREYTPDAVIKAQRVLGVVETNRRMDAGEPL